jgi:hypothetical protein
MSRDASSLNLSLYLPERTYLKVPTSKYLPQTLGYGLRWLGSLWIAFTHISGQVHVGLSTFGLVYESRWFGEGDLSTFKRD